MLSTEQKLLNESYEYYKCDFFLLLLAQTVLVIDEIWHRADNLDQDLDWKGIRG